MELRQPGQIVLLKFPHTDLNEGKLRPVLLLSKLPGNLNDWLICMVTTKHKTFTDDLDEEINDSDNDFNDSGLKSPSVLKILRIAVINRSIMLGKIGNISDLRLTRIKSKISKWILEN